MSTPSDKDNFARVLAVVSAVVAILALLMSGYFASKQYALQEKVFTQSQENLKLSSMLDQSAPIHLQPPRDTKVAGVLNATTQQLPNIRVRCKALVSNTSFTAISIKSYQVACQTQNGMWAIQLGKSLYTSDDVPIKAGTNIDAGKSLSLFIQGTCEISLNAFNLLRTEPMCSLSEADGILASHDTNLFGQAPQIQRMPDGLQVKAFTAKGYPSLSVRITTTRDRNFSWDIPWNGNDLF